MKTNNEIYNKKKRKIKKSFFGKKKSYKCIFHCDINANDCINSIDLIEDKVVFGTLMGDVLLCRVDENKLNANYNNTNTNTNNNNSNDNELHIIKNKNNKNNNSSKLIKSSLNKTDILDSDQSNIKINNNNNTPNNKYDCIQLLIGKNNNDEKIIYFFIFFIKKFKEQTNIQSITDKFLLEYPALKKDKKLVAFFIDFIDKELIQCYPLFI